MQGRKRVKLFILSISILILLIILYCQRYSFVERDETKKTAATLLLEFSDKYSQYLKDKKETISLEIKENRERKKAERELRKLLESGNFKEEEETDTVSENNEIPEIIDVSEDDIEESVITVSYNDPVEIKIPEDLTIPESISDINFRSVYGNVYSERPSGLYDSPTFENKIRESGQWEQFLRVGISEDCCYQLISEDGSLYYADGMFFRRFREDMPLTEEITLPKEKVLLDVPYISQFPSLPNGCEITSLAIVLNYLGFEVSKDTLSEDYLPKEKAGKANFFEEFVGEPSNRNSYGCYSEAIVTAANNYLSDNESEMRAENLTGCKFQEVMMEVKEGNPVILWGAAYIESEPSFSTEWIVDGEYLKWKTNLHCMVLSGYDLNKNIVYVSDPMRGIKEYDLEEFIKRFKQFYSQAIVIK